MINSTVKLGHNVVIKEGVIIGENVIIEDNVYIDYGCIIRDNVHIRKGSFIGARSILGEYLMDFYKDKVNKAHPLIIGENALIRTENVIYGDTIIGDNFQSGHKVTIRENTKIGNNAKIGTLSDIQHCCSIGNYVSIHSNVFVGEESKINDYVWIFPHVVITNDPTPPSDKLIGVTIEDFAIIAARSVLLPGVHIHEDALIGAGAIVTKDVAKETVAVGNPAKEICSVRKIKNKFTGEQVYPWRYTFKRGMPWKDSDYETWYNGLSI
ncbi:dTDP-3-amino-3,6-dideoxy-alpha-D-galactopyranose 3-N-acetyltransferase [Clostridium tepidiprofundi DSM 19306]|uniref:dTDP-3-amino-3,6-dideoxy-alpha-D-galactopyranose 3-N-acetyltransferase n=1 Tax=Clostridium tepidiprofundi DSM 19306 TaxID=1121338 RepID=A0A151ATE2_9CLOT|nr:N-acetyltransferase [Clostridium tepidiprofundi]KYH30667.1 dTDP-3-amino-3,6-dideoxy-alpha-D-galactopyranose 3-N-acetyltransferase [Clostridium tepidiprofundi DSM 19306]